MSTIYASINPLREGFIGEVEVQGTQFVQSKSIDLCIHMLELFWSNFPYFWQTMNTFLLGDFTDPKDY